MRLLVVEDDADLLDSLVDLFRGEGHVVATASSAATALEAARTGFDAALVDVLLPDGSGIDVVSTMRKSAPSIGSPIIVMTAFADDSITRSAIAAGATDFIRKPFDAQEVLGRIEVAWRAATDRERAIAEAEKRYRTLFEKTSEVILVTSGLVIVEANPAAEEVFGLTTGELKGRSLVDLSPPRQADGRSSREGLDALARSAEPGTWFAQGTRRRLLHLEAVIHSVPLPGIADARLVTARDVSRQRALEAQLHKAQRLEALGLLAGGVAHDFNNMLTAMVGYLELALASGPEALSGAPRLYLQEVRKAADRACDLARQLLAVGKQSPQSTRRALSIDDVVRRCTPLLERLLHEDVTLVLDLDCPNARILGDPAQLEQVFFNLAVNARDAMPSGGTLRIETDEVHLAPADAELLDVKPGAYLLVRVTDTGVGMSESVKVRIFDPFFTTKGADKGTGLGLSIVRAAVEQHGGAIAVDSAPGEGASFRVYFPVSNAPEAQESTPGPLRRGNETILVVEDDHLVRDVLVAMLETLGYRPIACESAKDAMHEFEQHRSEVAVVVTDVVMPDENGVDLERRLRALEPALKVVLVSGYKNENALPDNTVWLEKPVTIHALAGAFQTLLGPSS